jgi:hypothetical protein
VSKWPENEEEKKQHKDPVFWLFWTIFSKGMGLMIWLGLIFKPRHLGHTFCPLAGICLAFWVHLRVSKWFQMAKNSMKNLLFPKGMGLMIRNCEERAISLMKSNFCCRRLSSSSVVVVLLLHPKALQMAFLKHLVWCVKLS